MRIHRLALLTMLLLAIGSASAIPEEVVASSLTAAGTVQPSDLKLLHAINQQAPGDALRSLSLEAERISVVEVTQRQMQLPGGTIKTSPSQSSQSQSYEAVAYSLVATEDQIQFNLFTSGVRLTGAVDQLYQASIMGPVLHRMGINRGTDAAGGLFSTVSHQGEYVHNVLAGGSATLKVTGTFTLEIQGLHLRDNARSHELHSGNTNTLVGAGGVAQETETKVLRIRVTNGALAWSSMGLLHEWTSSATVMSAQGTVTLHDVHTDAGTLARTTWEGPVDLRVEPASEDALLVQPQPEPAAHAVQEAPEPTAMVVSGVAGVAAAVSAGAYLISRRREPSMQQVELLLTHGDHKAAATMAGKILRQEPGREEALLARAIALSKSGQPRRVVAEVGAHLAARPASDGSLHYVLGLAHLELGEKAAAESCLMRAAELTPGLQPEVASRLGVPAPRSSPSSPYAPAYA